jgi:translation elongation factor EF-G
MCFHMFHIFSISVAIPMNSAEVIKVAIEPLQPAELPKMVDGLRLAAMDGH